MSISLLGVVLVVLPESTSLFIKNHIECFLIIPPISVASYILVFKYHEKFNGKAPPFDELISTIMQGSFFAAIFFFLIAICSSAFFRLYISMKTA